MRFILLLAVSMVWSINSGLFDDSMDKAALLSVPSKKSALSENLPVYGPIADSVYLVGPGDVITISLWGNVLEEEYEMTVDAEGKLLIPKFGLIDAATTLKEVRTRIEKIIQSKSRNVQIICRITRVKTSLISICGEVVVPGTYEFNSTVRLDDVIACASTREQRVEWPRSASMRNVKIRRSSGETLSVDFEDYYRNGTEANNPPVFAGDQVIVPVKSCSVSVSGSVLRSGTFDYRFQSALDLIHFAGGLSPDADSQNIVVYGFGNREKGVQSLTLNSIEACRDYQLKKDDCLVVGRKPFYHKRLAVSLQGRVKFPGQYQFEEGTTVQQALDAAGGLLSDADSNTASLTRCQFLKNYINPDFRNGLRENIPFNPLMVALNLGSGNSGNRGNTHLLDMDVILVPQKMAVINVSGRVTRPGVYAYVSGKNWKDYVSEAGGFDKNAYKGRTKIYKKARDAWIYASGDVCIDAGDVILVPETPQEYYWDKIKDTITITSGLLSVMVTFLVLSQ
ncbi:MAG: hypothetical protein A2293_05010 [Elusimicrobia bacterium RIFOXYB2_FULL_49_7]|nr:MAG: hypothetical protein A2293_05010 [Elusimicrobia bacterium RIFOXYB2_FULL_49_7]